MKAKKTTAKKPTKKNSTKCKAPASDKKATRNKSVTKASATKETVLNTTEKKSPKGMTPTADCLGVELYCINKGQKSQYFGLKTTEGDVLQYAPNNWKTPQGALRWATKNGFAIADDKSKSTTKPLAPTVGTVSTKSLHPKKPVKTATTSLSQMSKKQLAEKLWDDVISTYPSSKGATKEHFVQYMTTGGRLSATKEQLINNIKTMPPYKGAIQPIASAKAVNPAPKAQTPASVHKRGTKADYMAKNGIKIRPVTAKDKQYARTDYQKNADYIISINGKQYFSTNGSLADCKTVVQLTKQQAGGQNGKK